VQVQEVVRQVAAPTVVETIAPTYVQPQVVETIAPTVMAAPTVVETVAPTYAAPVIEQIAAPVTYGTATLAAPTVVGGLEPQPLEPAMEPSFELSPSAHVQRWALFKLSCFFGNVFTPAV